MFIIFLGAPGAGKGTQAAFIVHELGLAHIATGDLFRQALKEGTSLGLKAKSYMEKGKLVPDKVTVQMVLDRLLRTCCLCSGVEQQLVILTQILRIPIQERYAPRLNWYDCLPC